MPLTGVKVLDLTRVLSGPFCTALLGDMGARVIKIEPPEGDVLRRRKRETEPYPLVMLNSNKESVVLDLKQPRAIEAIRRMVPKVDVVMENFRPGVMDKLGIGYEELKKENNTLPWAGREDTAVHMLFDGAKVKRSDGQEGVPVATVSYFFVSGNRSESDFMRQQLIMALERLFNFFEEVVSSHYKFHRIFQGVEYLA